MEYKGMSLVDAAAKVIHERILKIGGDGGLIAVDVEGNVAMPFNHGRHVSSLQKWNGETALGIYKD